MQTEIEIARLRMQRQADAMNEFMMAEQGYLNLTGGTTYWLVYEPVEAQPLPHQENQLIPLSF